MANNMRKPNQHPPIDKVDFTMGIIVGFILGVLFLLILYCIFYPYNA